MTRILKINNCFECKYNKTEWLIGYVCKLDEFPPHCRLLETDEFLDRENKIREIFT